MLKYAPQVNNPTTCSKDGKSLTLEIAEPDENHIHEEKSLHE